MFQLSVLSDIVFAFVIGLFGFILGIYMTNSHIKQTCLNENVLIIKNLSFECFPKPNK